MARGGWWELAKPQGQCRADGWVRPRDHRLHKLPERRQVRTSSRCVPDRITGRGSLSSPSGGMGPSTLLRGAEVVSQKAVW